MKRSIEIWMIAGAEKAIRVLRGEKGVTVIEYALVAVLIAIALILAFRSAGVDSGISGAAGKINSMLSTPP
jgi:Flp pilus assembly pilin Flp